MKRLLTVLCLAALVGVLVQSAAAIQMREIDVRWSRAGYPASNDSSVALVRVRSTTFVAAATAQPIDTTEWIPLWEDIAWSDQRLVSAATDSITALFDVVPDAGISSALGITVAADTIVTSIQASMDGVNPVAVTATFAGPHLETSSNNAVYKTISIGRQFADNGTAPSNLKLLPYRYIRFIVSGDHVGAYRAHWRYPGPDKYLPYREHR